MNQQTTQGLRAFRAALFVVLCFCLALLAGCEDYDTDSLGNRFRPHNSLVSRFVHPVYIEYQVGEVRVWGREADVACVDARIEGAHLSLDVLADSLALFVYGNAMGDTLPKNNASLRIESDCDYALYLEGLKLYSTHGPCLSCQGQGTCYLVLVNNSRSVFIDADYQDVPHHDGANGCLEFGCPLIFDGVGTLSVESQADTWYDADYADSVRVHALLSDYGVLCNYGAKVDLRTHSGSAIYTDGGEVKLVKGTWRLYHSPMLKGIETMGGTISFGDSVRVTVNDSIYDGVKFL